MSYGNRPLPVVVICSSDEMVATWQDRRAKYPDLDIAPEFPVPQAWRLVGEIVARYDGVVVLCQEHVWFGIEFASAASRLAEELDRDFPGWGACGNRGCVWEGAILYDYTSYTRNQGAGIGAALAPRPVLTLDD